MEKFELLYLVRLHKKAVESETKELGDSIGFPGREPKETAEYKEYTDAILRYASRGWERALSEQVKVYAELNEKLARAVSMYRHDYAALLLSLIKQAETRFDLDDAEFCANSFREIAEAADKAYHDR